MMEDDNRAMRTIVRAVVVISAILFVAYIALVAAGTYMAARESGVHAPSQALLPMLAAFNGIGRSAWEFARPLLQLLVVLVIIDWALKRFGIQLTGAATGSKHFNWDVQAIIAVIVIAAYAIAQLAGLGGDGMKDIALVVVGFYFGTQRRSYEVDPQTGKMRVIEDHTSALSEQQGAQQGKQAPAVEGEPKA